MYKLEASINGFDSIFISDNLLYYRINNHNYPLVDIHDDGTFDYDELVYGKIIDLLSCQEIFENYSSELYNYYTNIDKKLDMDKRKMVLIQLDTLMKDAKKENVLICLKLMDRSTHKYVKVHRIICKEQGQGLGTKYMNKIVELARSHGLMVALTPNNILGTPVSQLLIFYKKLGFRECDLIGVSEDLYMI